MAASVGIVVFIALGACSLENIPTEGVSSNTFSLDAFNVTNGGRNVWIHGAILDPSTPVQAQEVLAAVGNKQNYETVAVLSTTDYSYNTINEFIDTIQSIFPSATIVPMGLQPGTPNTEAIGYNLDLQLPEQSLVIALVKPNLSSHAGIQELQEGFTHQVLSHFHEVHFKNLPFTHTVQLQVLNKYLRRRAAQNPVVVEGHQALFQKGSVPVKSETSPTFMVVFGDVMLGRFVNTLMEQHGHDYPFEKMDAMYLRSNDILLANLEGPITTNAFRTNTGMRFSFFPFVGPLLKKYHFDLVSLANNHAFDMGNQGFVESFALLREQSIVPFGNAQQVANESAATVTVRGQTFSFLGLEDINNPINEAEAVKAIQELSQNSQVIVFPHWGTEYVHTPTQRQRQLAHMFVDAGAYAVIGHHPHVVQTYETYQGHPIFYSLGNAIFDQYWSEPTQEGLSLALAMSPEKITIYFMPIKIDRSQMRLMNAEESAELLARLVSWGDHSDQESSEILDGKLELSLKKDIISNEPAS